MKRLKKAQVRELLRREWDDEQKEAQKEQDAYLSSYDHYEDYDEYDSYDYEDYPDDEDDFEVVSDPIAMPSWLPDAMVDWLPRPDPAQLLDKRFL